MSKAYKAKGLDEEAKSFLQQWKISILSILRISLVYLDKSIKGIPGRLDLELGLAVAGTSLNACAHTAAAAAPQRRLNSSDTRPGSRIRRKA